MRRRVGRRQQHVVPARGQFDRHRRGDRRLADAALAHGHDQPLAGARDLVDQARERRQVGQAVPHRRRRRDRVVRRHAAQRRQPDEVLGPKDEAALREASEVLVHAGDRRGVPRCEGRGQRVALGVVRHDAVDRQVLVRDADPGELACGARRLGERRDPRPGDEDQPGERSVSEAVDGGRGIASAASPGPRAARGRRRRPCPPRESRSRRRAASGGGWCARSARCRR